MHLAKSRQNLAEVGTQARVPLPTSLYDVRIFPRHVFGQRWALVLEWGEEDRGERNSPHIRANVKNVKKNTRRQSEVLSVMDTH
jgi:hypothetical protein